MSNKQHIYLGPYLRINRESLPKLGDDESVYEFTDGNLTEATNCSGDIDRDFEIALPNCGLLINREPELMDEDVGVTDILDIDIEDEMAEFADRYMEPIKKIAAAVGESNSEICWGYVIYWC